MATQTDFIVITKPTSKAGQLKSFTSLGAATNMATVKAILTISHRKNPKTAVAGFSEENRPIRPRAKIAAGNTTASAPYAADQAADALWVTAQVANATTPPATACQHTTCQGDTCGFC